MVIASEALARLLAEYRRRLVARLGDRLVDLLAENLDREGIVL